MPEKEVLARQQHVGGRDEREAPAEVRPPDEGEKQHGRHDIQEVLHGHGEGEVVVDVPEGGEERG
ncbi:MAG: hypothetical protein JWM31_1537 [Solirubrobacterales bacterium]|nr:hypothetical protein [Solirubrobacterales bacterium]